MSARSRSRNGGPISGRYREGSSYPWNYRNVTSSEEVCDDVVGNRDGQNPFLLTYTYRDPAVVSATGNYLGGSYSSMENLPVHSGAVDLTHLSLPGTPSLGSLGTSAVARTNPSRVHVSLPVLIYELREVPSLIHRFGRDAFANIGDANLRWQFGLAPLIADLRRLANFQAVVERRARELDSLSQNGGLRRRVVLSDDVAEVSGVSNPINSVPHTLRYRYRKMTRRKIWATTRWRPSDTFTSLSSDERDKYMRRTLLGLTRAQVSINLWNALPWSWLSDWVNNFGDLIEASNNSIGYLDGQCCVMTHRATTYVGEAYTTGANSLARVLFLKPTGRYETGTKRRELTSPVFSASMPFLTGRQLSIIGSLAAQRLR